MLVDMQAGKQEGKQGAREGGLVGGQGRKVRWKTDGMERGCLFDR